MAVTFAPTASSTWRARLRGQLLSVAASVHSLAALAALLDPDRVADAMGLFPVGVNGYSQFFALYVGVRLATAGLALLAARQGDQPILGDLAALFILAQPLGRLVAAFAIGLPQGLLFVVSGIELAVGLALIGLRPQGRFLSIRPSP
ncbi:hypothetical protein ASD28_02015 [Massilia sp. Root133]|uniref:hypothetical protein n=1 Tax=unclassified Massilia TaxID=2609279 RepID=UPI0006FA8FE7|nr:MULTISPECIES: hypothetical protein [unclassified Massilia]KQY18946.1 hypothetical protein ASD28_02015 [Massilia sp. Root133]KQZ53502.1 hypothetical protein ASD92_10830 [Massilia sp. Root1485]